MTDAKRDNNGIATLIGVSNADGVTPLRAYIDSSTNRMLVNATITGTVTVTGAGAGGASMVDDSAFTVGTDSVSPIGAMFDDVSPDSVDEGDGGILRMSANRVLYVQLRDAAGNERGLNVDASGRIAVTIGGTVTVDNGGTFVVQVDGAALTSLQLLDDVVKTDDSAFTPGTDKVAMVGAEFDDTTPDSVDEGDAGALRMSSRRELYTQLRDAAGNERGANVDASNRLTVLADLGATDNAVLDAIAASLAIMDDWDDNDKAKVVLGANATDNGPDPYFDSDGDNTAQALKASAGNLYKINVYNPNTAIAFVQLFDTAAGSVTVGTTTPVYVIPVPSEGFTIEDFVPGLSFGTAITYACTTTATGSGDPTTGLTLSATFK